MITNIEINEIRKLNEQKLRIDNNIELIFKTFIEKFRIEFFNKYEFIESLQWDQITLDDDEILYKNIPHILIVNFYKNNDIKEFIKLKLGDSIDNLKFNITEYDDDLTGYSKEQINLLADELYDYIDLFSSALEYTGENLANIYTSDATIVMYKNILEIK
jgi:hypothetical protein